MLSRYYWLLICWIMQVQHGMPFPHLGSNPGGLQGARLTYFMPLEHKAMGDELVLGKIERALPYFKRESYKAPASLPLFLCYIQAEPKAWKPEEARLMGLLQQQPNNLFYKAQLGAIYYYQWCVSPAPKAKDLRELKRAMSLVKPLWDEKQDPVAGLLLIDFHYQAGYNSKDGDTIKETMLRFYGGEKVFAKYLKDKAKDWRNTTPPPASWVPKENWRSLKGVVAIDYVRFSVQSSILLGNPKGPIRMELNPRPPAQERAFQYFKRWIEDLTANIAKS